MRDEGKDGGNLFEVVLRKDQGINQYAWKGIYFNSDFLSICVNYYGQFIIINLFDINIILFLLALFALIINGTI